MLERDDSREARRFEVVAAALEDVTPWLEAWRPGSCAFGVRGPVRLSGGEVNLVGRTARLVVAALDDLVGSSAGHPGCGIGVADGRFAAGLAAGAADASVVDGGGAVVNISSIFGRESGGSPQYNATKSAQLAMAKVYALDWAKQGIRVNTIAPGSTETAMTANYSEEEWDNVRSRAVLGRPGQPEDIAEAARFLISDKASYITGEIFNVNGGANFA